LLQVDSPLLLRQPATKYNAAVDAGIAELRYLHTLGITSQQAVKVMTEAALLGSAIEHGFSPELIILSDGTQQFVIGIHALCWVYAERSIRRQPWSHNC
jgi:hypothetical protein